MTTKHCGLALVLSLLAAFAYSQEKKQAESLPPGWWSIPKTEAQFTVGGYVKFDLIQDFNPINAPSFFDVSKIPTNGSKGTNTRLQANETRLFLDFRMPAGKHKLRTYVEGDFYGTNGAFRLRHAILEIDDRWMAGQYWSNFMDENIIPATLDFEKPTAYAFVRHGMIRYKFPTGKKSYVAVALEEPLIDVQAPSRPGKMETFVPDVTARYRHTDAWGHVQLSGFVGMVRFRPQTGSVENSVSYGLNLSGQFNLPKKDMLTYQLLFGPGVPRYRAGKYAAPNASDKLKSIPSFGITGSYKHFWTPKLSSLLVANYGSEQPLDSQPSSDIKSAFYGAVNLIWQVIPSAFAGIEYLHGGRHDISQASGRANRLQLSVQVDINKH